MNRLPTRIVLSIFTIGIFLPQARAYEASFDVAPQSKQEFCQRHRQAGRAIELAENSDNRLAFVNQGGIFNGGVCWWHSLFQRAALYNVVFRPELAKPTAAQAKKLIHSIASGKKVVEIPGYRNLREFSSAWQKLIQDKLEEWQLVDGILKFAWIKGLSGSPSIAPLKLERKVTGLIDLVEKSQDIHWTMLQMKGVTAHAALILGGRNQAPLFSLTNIDSNSPLNTYEFIYHSGDPSIFHPWYDKFVPYLGRRSDLKRFQTAAARYCSAKPMSEAVVTEDLNNDFD